MKIIGITGTLGAGKGTVVDYLQHKGFKHYSARSFFIDELKRRNIEANRDTITELANELRRTHGAGYVAEELYKKALADGADAVIESIRTPAEARVLASKGTFTLLAVDADPNIRYERISGRGSETDNVSFEKFLADEKREMQNDDETKQNIKAVMEKADAVITNNGSLEDLHAQVDKITEQI